MDDVTGQLPIRPRQLIRDQVFATLAEKIVTGQLAPLEEIRDQDLQAEYGISRTPIREALNRLVDLGLIEVSTNRFTRVAPIDLDAQADRVETAAAMIGYCVIKAVPGYSDAQVDDFLGRIDAILDTDLELASTRDGLTHWYALWAAIVISADNQTMLDILDGQLALHLTRTAPMQRLPEGMVADMRRSLAGLRTLLQQRDARGARELIEQLFLRTSIAPLRAAALVGERTDG